PARAPTRDGPGSMGTPRAAGRGGRGGPFGPVALEPPAWNGGGFAPAPAPLPEPDSATRALPERTPLIERGGPFALSDSVLGQRPARYRWRLAPEAGPIGALAASSYGFAGSTQILVSDFLGDPSPYFAGDEVPNS